MWMPHYWRSPAAYAAASGGDPYWANVVLLAGNESGADGTTTFLDQSASAHTLTAVGNAQWDTAQAPTGLTSSILLDGAGDSVDAADSTDWSLSTGDFAFEGFCYVTGVGLAGTYFTVASTWAGVGGWGVYGRRSDRALVFWNGAAVRVSTGILSNSAFSHWAVSRTSGNLKMYLDGTQVYNAAEATTLDTAAGMWIGRDAANQAFDGWQASVRLTKGSNRGYTGATITVPTLPLPTS